jgi:DNA-3-methyladenine glycosylase II
MIFFGKPVSTFPDHALTPKVVMQSNTITHIRCESDLDAALVALVAADSRFAALIATAGRPPLRRRPDGFVGLATTVVSQQLSTASAAAIWARLVAAFNPFDPQAIIRARPARLARLGLSAPKIRALKEIARAVTKSHLALGSLAEATAEDAHASLTAVHGIGPWTADIYLLSCLGHADAWPAGDLALQEAARLAFGLPGRPSAKEMVPLAEAWRPLRAVAARVLWTYYRAVKGREGAPVLPKTDSEPKSELTPEQIAKPQTKRQPKPTQRSRPRKGSSPLSKRGTDGRRT